MKMNRQLVVALVTVAGALCWQSAAQAATQALGADQDKPAAGQRSAQWRQRMQDWRAQGQGNLDADQVRARIGDRLKTMLRANDEEWKVIQPLVEDVVIKQGAAMRGQIGGMISAWGMFGRVGGAKVQPGDPQPPQRPPGSAEALALRQAVEAENAPVAEIKAKLQNYREAQKKSEAALKDSRDKLRVVLGHRQEAQLVWLGILD